MRVCFSKSLTESRKILFPVPPRFRSLRAFQGMGLVVTQEAYSFHGRALESVGHIITTYYISAMRGSLKL
jgi:hypothetical protein